MKTIVFDIDETLTVNGSWERLNTAAGMTREEDFALYTGHFSGEYNYEIWTQKIGDIYKRKAILTQETAAEVLVNFTLKPGAAETIQTLQERGHKVILITGGFYDTAKAVAHQLGVTDYFYMTKIIWSDDGQFERFQNQGYEDDGKLAQLKEYCTREGIDITDCVAVGDSRNDIPLFVATGCGVTFDWSKPVVQEAATYIITNLTDILSLAV